MRIAVPRRLRKTNRQPEKGSVSNLSWHNCASESMPLRPSTGFHRHQDAHLRGDLNHAPSSHNARLSATNSAGPTPLNSIFIRPRGPSNSTTALATLPGRGVINSINVGGAGGRAWRGITDRAFLTTFFSCPGASARSFSLPYSRCRAFAVRSRAQDGHTGGGAAPQRCVADAQRRQTSGTHAQSSSAGHAQEVATFHELSRS